MTVLIKPFVFTNKLNTSDLVVVAHTTPSQSKTTIVANLDADQFKYGCATKHEIQNADGTVTNGVFQIAEKIVYGTADLQEVFTNYQGIPMSFFKVEITTNNGVVSIECSALDQVQIERLAEIWSYHHTRITPMQFAQIVLNTIYGTTFYAINDEIVRFIDSNIYNAKQSDAEKNDHIRNVGLKLEIKELVGEHLNGLIPTHHDIKF
jgi:hypothetical protein